MVQIIKKSGQWGFETVQRVAPQPEREQSELTKVALNIHEAQQVRHNAQFVPSVVRLNPRNGLVFIACVLIRCYQWFIRPILPGCCRFYPSCSEYTLTALVQYGVLRGGWKSLRRLVRCHPWSSGGYDPVIINKEKN